MTPLKQRLWEASNRNLYRIVMAAANINQPFPDGDYEAILREVERIKSLSLRRRVAAADTLFNPRRE